MTKVMLKRLLSWCLVLVLITATALTMASCDRKDSATDGTHGTLPVATDKSESTTEEPATDDSEPAPEEIGTFTLTVVFADGTQQTASYPFYEEGTLGDFLVANDIAEGEDGDYGLYIKSVLGETHDYDTDGSYWAFYMDGEYAMTGVSETELTDGAEYTLKAE